MPDLDTPLPDPAHEDLRQATKATTEAIADHVQQLADSFLLAQTTAEALVIALQTVTTLQAAVADLTTRVTALEQAGDVPPPTP